MSLFTVKYQEIFEVVHSREEDFYPLYIPTKHGTLLFKIRRILNSANFELFVGPTNLASRILNYSWASNNSLEFNEISRISRILE